MNDTIQLANEVAWGTSMKSFATILLFLLILGTCTLAQAQNSGYCPNCAPATGADAGSANNYVVSAPGCLSTLTAGFSIVTFKALNASTSTAPTLTFCSGVAHSIVKGTTQAPLVSGDITSNAYTTYLWDGTYWVLQNPTYPAASLLSLTCSIPSTSALSTFFCLNNGTESSVELPIDFNFNITSISCWIPTTSGLGSSTYWTLTLNKNGAACNSSSIQLKTQGAMNLWQTTGSCSGSRGDTIDLSLTQTGSPPSESWNCNLSGYRF